MSEAVRFPRTFYLPPTTLLTCHLQPLIDQPPIVLHACFFWYDAAVLVWYLKLCCRLALLTTTGDGAARCKTNVDIPGRRSVVALIPWTLSGLYVDCGLWTVPSFCVCTTLSASWKIHTFLFLFYNDEKCFLKKYTAVCLYTV